MELPVLSEAEKALVALVKASPLAERIKDCTTLPNLSDESLVSRFVTDAPAVYVALGPGSFKSHQGKLRAGFACVAKNSRGHEASRHGDGKAIGLYELVDAVMVLADGANTGGATWQVVSFDFLASEALSKAGVYAAVVQIETAGDIQLADAIDETALADFTTFGADYDVPPHEAGTEHTKWLEEPPDLTSSRPDVSEINTIQP